ncbi:MAG: hypothetical protein IJ731_07080 [Eubacterium sp.]|nr:hypothetical protein [Eubacterium sp.]
MRSSSKNDVNIVIVGDNNHIESGSKDSKKSKASEIISAVAKGIAIIIVAVAVACRLLTVSDGVVQHILEKALEANYSSSIVVMYR